MSKNNNLIAVTALAVCLSSFSFDSNAQDLRLDNLFDSYASGSAGAVQTRGGTVFSGGSFSARFNQPNVQVLSFQPPSASAGCGGLDMVAGSFGFMSKDSIVQVGRAVAQGAASYFFKLSLSSICASCAKEMEQIQAKIQQLNNFAKNACQNTQKALADKFSDPAQRTRSVADDWRERSNIASAAVGAVDSGMELMLNESGIADFHSNAKDEQADGNATADQVEELNIADMGDFSFFTEISGGGSEKERLANFLMTIMGSDITRYDPASDNIEYETVAPGIDIEHYITGSNPDFPKQYTRITCNSADCNSVSKTQSTWDQSVYHQIKARLNDIMSKIISPSEGTVSAADRDFERLTNMSMQTYAVLSTRYNIQQETVVEWLAYQATRTYIDGFRSAIAKVLESGESVTKTEDGLDLFASYQASMKDVLAKIDSAKDTLTKRQQGVYQTIDTAIGHNLATTMARNGG